MLEILHTCVLYPMSKCDITLEHPVGGCRRRRRFDLTRCLRRGRSVVPRVWWTTSSGSCSRCRRMAAARRASSPRSPPSSSTTPTGSSTTSAACWTPAEPSHHSPPRPSLVTCRARFFLPRTILSFASTAGGRASHAPTGSL